MYKNSIKHGRCVPGPASDSADIFPNKLITCKQNDYNIIAADCLHK